VPHITALAFVLAVLVPVRLRRLVVVTRGAAAIGLEIKSGIVDRPGQGRLVFVEAVVAAVLGILTLLPGAAGLFDLGRGLLGTGPVLALQQQTELVADTCRANGAVGAPLI
jgi:hypothetical protein